MPSVVFTPSAQVTSPITKVGGQPVWLSAPTWPLSASTGEPMSSDSDIGSRVGSPPS